jgi:hypothetical protein
MVGFLLGSADRDGVFVFESLFPGMGVAHADACGLQGSTDGVGIDVEAGADAGQ